METRRIKSHRSNEVRLLGGLNTSDSRQKLLPHPARVADSRHD